jgi:hypothetical protein
MVQWPALVSLVTKFPVSQKAGNSSRAERLSDSHKGLCSLQIFVKYYDGKIIIPMNNSIMQSSHSYSKHSLSIRLCQTCGLFPSEFPTEMFASLSFMIFAMPKSSLLI